MLGKIPKCKGNKSISMNRGSMETKHQQKGQIMLDISWDRDFFIKRRMLNRSMDLGLSWYKTGQGLIKNLEGRSSWINRGAHT